MDSIREELTGLREASALAFTLDAFFYGVHGSSVSDSPTSDTSGQQLISVITEYFFLVSSVGAHSKRSAPTILKDG